MKFVYNFFVQKRDRPSKKMLMTVSALNQYFNELKVPQLFHPKMTKAHL